MSRNSTEIEASPAAVFAVLADGHTYEHWVVGCKKIRSVDDAWPARGTRFHHRVGLGPFNVADYTEVLADEPGRVLVLRVRARPVLPAAKVTFTLEAHASGTTVTMTEEPLDEATRRIWNPLIDVLGRLRNAECLRRLTSIVEARANI